MSEVTINDGIAKLREWLEPQMESRIEELAGALAMVAAGKFTPQQFLGVLHCYQETEADLEFVMSQDFIQSMMKAGKL